MWSLPQVVVVAVDSPPQMAAFALAVVVQAVYCNQLFFLMRTQR
jgi:hypothetical protein